jgi:hypothetical protein
MNKKYICIGIAIACYVTAYSAVEDAYPQEYANQKLIEAIKEPSPPNVRLWIDYGAKPAAIPKKNIKQLKREALYEKNKGRQQLYHEVIKLLRRNGASI